MVLCFPGVPPSPPFWQYRAPVQFPAVGGVLVCIYNDDAVSSLPPINKRYNVNSIKPKETVRADYEQTTHLER